MSFCSIVIKTLTLICGGSVRQKLSSSFIIESSQESIIKITHLSEGIKFTTIRSIKGN